MAVTCCPCIGGQQYLVCGYLGLWCCHQDADGCFAISQMWRVFEQAHAQSERRSFQTAYQLSRVHRAAALPRPGTAVKNRRLDFSLYVRLVELDRIVAILEIEFVVFIDGIEPIVADRNLHLAAPIDIAIDLIAFDALFECIHVFTAESFEFGNVLGKNTLGIIDAVHHRGRHDRSWSPAGAVGDAFGFDQHDIACGILLLRLDRGPEATESAADD